MRTRKRMRHGALTAAMIAALALALVAGAAESARASDWTGVSFPKGETVQDIAEDSAGNIWTTTIEESGTFGHVEVLWKGASEWQDACPGLDWDYAQWSDGLSCVGDKLFLTTTDGKCFARSPGDTGWHAIDSSLQFLPLADWNGYLWSGSTFHGVVRLDPGTESAETVNDGLLIVMDNPEQNRNYRNPRGNGQYLYVGATVSAAAARQAGFAGVSVYRLARGGTTWEDTGLNVTPEASDLDFLQGEDAPEWGVWHLVAMDGYVLCQVLAPAGGFPVKCFLFDERAGSWSPVEMPEVRENGWYYLASGEPCFVRDGAFYFPTGFVAEGVVCDVLTPASKTWRRDVTVPGTPWKPLAHTAQLVGDRLLVAYGGKTSFVEAVPLPTQLSKDPKVIGTNFFLALLFAAIFGFTSILFNNTLKSNYAEVVRIFAPFTRASKAMGRGLARLMRGLGNGIKRLFLRSARFRRLSSRTPRVSSRVLEPLALALVAGLVYGFLDPTFGFSGHGVAIFVALAVSVAAVTYTYEGVQALASSQGYHVPARVKLFPAAIVVAIICVVISRLIGFTPGYLYGFVGGLAFLGAQEPDDRKKAKLALVACCCLLALSLAAWFLVIPVTEAVNTGSSWLTLLQSICVAIFVVGLEALLFGLVPLTFFDGGYLLRWNKAVWAVLFTVAAFLFWHVLLNKNSAYGAAFSQTSAKIVIIALAFWTVITVGIFLYFRRRTRRAAQWAGAGAGPVPPAPWAPQGYQAPPAYQGPATPQAQAAYQAPPATPQPDPGIPPAPAQPDAVKIDDLLGGAGRPGSGR